MSGDIHCDGVLATGVGRIHCSQARRTFTGRYVEVLFKPGATDRPHLTKTCYSRPYPSVLFAAALPTGVGFGLSWQGVLLMPGPPI